MPDVKSTNPIPAAPALRVPATLEEALDPTWLGEALASVSQGAKVVAVETVEVIKTVATKVRFTVTFNGAAGTQAFCLKGLLDVDEMTKMGGSTCVLEGDYYLKLASQVDVQVPEAVAVVTDREASRACSSCATSSRGVGGSARRSRPSPPTTRRAASHRSPSSTPAAICWPARPGLPRGSLRSAACRT
jgi:hypothetical protein